MSNSGYRITASTGIHRGDRAHQQDQVGLICHPHVKDCMLAVLADGMGGRLGGLKAAEQVILAARQLLTGYSPAANNATELLEHLVQEAHAVIKLTAIASEEPPYSTIAACLVNPDGSCHWIHVGDSRVYHFRGQQLISCTKDHSYAQSLTKQDSGNGQPVHFESQSSTLTACLGGDAEPPVEIASIDKLEPGETLVLCSDGLWHYFSDAELGCALSSLPPRQTSEILIDKARFRAKGEGDNLSLVIIKAHGAN